MSGILALGVTGVKVRENADDAELHDVRCILHDAYRGPSTRGSTQLVAVDVWHAECTENVPLLSS